MQKRWHANLSDSIGCPPTMELACVRPFPDLFHQGGVRRAVTIEGYHLNFHAASRTPGQRYLCPAHNHQRFSLNSDFCYLHGHALHASIASGLRPIASCAEPGLQVLKERLTICDKTFQMLFLTQSKALTGKLRPALCAPLTNNNGHASRCLSEDLRGRLP
jgi:hypothetical protein